MLKVVLVGPESTGKTTLCKELARQFSSCWVPEICRLMAEERSQKDNEINFHFTLDDFIKMAHQQNTLEQYLTMQANKILFCDNDSFAVSIWCERYLEQYKSEIYDIYKRANIHDNKIYIVMKPNVPFVQDGYRDGEHIREWMFERFIEELDKNQLHYYIIDSPEYDERLKRVIHIIKNNIK
jgi:HTH-type transcriptional repressor of NAD biosynthesis genes